MFHCIYVHLYFTRYGFSDAADVYSPFGYECTGNEATISECAIIHPGRIRCTEGQVESEIAIICGELVSVHYI